MTFDLDFLTKIHDAIPGYRAAQKASAVLAKIRAGDFAPLGGRRSRFPMSTTPSHFAADVVLDAIASGEQVQPAMFLDAADEIGRATVAFESAKSALRIAQDYAKQQVSDAYDDGRDHILAGLNTALADLLADIKKLEPLSEIDSAESAIRTDRGKDYQRLEDLLGGYVDIRREQWRVYRANLGSDDFNKSMIEAAVMRNVREVFPLWPVWRDQGYLVGRGHNGTQWVVPPWVNATPGRDNGSRFTSSIAQDTTSTYFLRWAIESGADLWVPTVEEFERSAAALAATIDRGRGYADDEWQDPLTADPTAGLEGLTRDERVIYAREHEERLARTGQKAFLAKLTGDVV